MDGTEGKLRVGGECEKKEQIVLERDSGSGPESLLELLETPTLATNCVKGSRNRSLNAVEKTKVTSVKKA